MNNNFLNLLISIILSVVIIFGWHHFYEKPRIDKLQEQNIAYQNQLAQEKKRQIQQKEQKTESSSDAQTQASKPLDPRLNIKSASLSGSISLKGLRFDDLTLTKYKEALSDNSEMVNLLSKSHSKAPYFAEIGWLSDEPNITLPNSNTLWQADKTELTPTQTVNLSWKSPENINFIVTITMDEDYMFSLNQRIENNSNKPVTIKFHGLINRLYQGESERAMNILHQGMIGAINGELQEYSYDTVKEKVHEKFEKNKVNWLGITDKYWLTAFIPDPKESYNSNYRYAMQGGSDRYQTDFISSGQLIQPGASYEMSHHLFAGAKKVDLLDKYENKYNIKLFDRAIDFGWFYILTKPIFNAMNFFYNYVGNFGISIMIVTIIIKLLMFTLANKSYRSMKKMKKLQPDMERIKALYAEDKARLNQEIMALYKREKVNPVSGCLPIFIQIPVFFSIYKVLYVTIEMRHAPFFGWIHDLSASDPTTFINLFGLLPFAPPAFLPAFLHIGIWPIIMASTMFLQQRMSPAPADPVQAQVMKIMPLMFLFMFGSFPAGLLIYWSWNNLLSIIQQSYINTLDKNE